MSLQPRERESQKASVGGDWGRVIRGSQLRGEWATDHFTAVIFITSGSVWGHKDWKVRTLQKSRLRRAG